MRLPPHTQSNLSLDQALGVIQSIQPIIKKVSKNEPLTPAEIIAYTQVTFMPGVAQFLLSSLQQKPSGESAASTVTTLAQQEATSNELTVPSGESTASTVTTLAKQEATSNKSTVFSSSLENRENTFRNLDTSNSPSLSRLIKEVWSFVQEPLEKGSRILHLFGPPGVGKTHLMTASLREFEMQNKKVLFVRGDELFKYAGSVDPILFHFEKVLDLNFDVILIDDLNSVNTWERQNLRKLILWAFDKGSKKIIISSNITADDLIKDIVLNVRFIKDKNGDQKPVPGTNPEEARIYSRYKAMTKNLDFSGIPTKRAYTH
ncbi:MAG: Chromosomal replication initiator protein DnaA [Holosporales bacterium]